MTNKFFAFSSFNGDEVFTTIAQLINRSDNFSEEDKMAYSNAVLAMSEGVERFGIVGNPWHVWLAWLFVGEETVFSRAHERRSDLSGSFDEMAKIELNTLAKYISYDLKKLDKILGTDIFSKIEKFEPLRKSKSEAALRIQLLAGLIGNAKSGEELYSVLEQFYARFGTGNYALFKAFRWDSRKHEIVPVTNTEDISLSGIIGYEDQKRILCENTEAFLEGRPANNVLLYGESGTGKSSTIKAILNEYAAQGLRMVEVYKHQIEDLDAVIDEIKNRNYRFVLFMDDLSFEQFEIEYKYLKSFIEGGLEKKPDNVLIYATSNRRHLMKESWKDKEDIQEDMHESETMQEKMSLVDRFGLLIRFLSPAQKEYLEIAHGLAAEYGVEVDEEFDHGAIRWELQHGGFSGRSARQYVEHIAGRKQ